MHALWLLVFHMTAAGLMETPVYVAGQDGYHSYRIPAIVTSKQGTLLAFCEGRRNSRDDTGDIDILLRRSADGGKTWDAQRVVNADPQYLCGNPAPVALADGSVVLVFTRRKEDATEKRVLEGEADASRVLVTRSTDDGLTWAEPVDITADASRPDWRWYATGPCHGIQMECGRVIIPCNHSKDVETSTWHSHVIYSDDAGATWRTGGVHDNKTNESTVVELAGGWLYQNMRNYRGTHRRAWALSKDRGMTWSPAADDETLIEPVCQASVIRWISSKKNEKDPILFSNPASTKRENMTIRVSYDQCKSWPLAKTLHPGPAAYSDLAILPDGMIACLYEKGQESAYETISVAVFDLPWLGSREGQ